jgi:hypothetical protein
MKICCHYGGVSTCCRNGGDVHLQEFRRVGRIVVLFWQVRPELGWPGRRTKMIRERGAAHAGQRDTRPEPGTLLGFAVLPQQSLDRGCDPRCLVGAHAPSVERLERLRDPRSFVGAPAPYPERPGHPLPHACG